MSLTPAESRLASAIGFDADICELLKEYCGDRLCRMTTLVDHGRLLEVDGLAAVGTRESVSRFVSSLQSKIAPRGYRAFWSEILAPNGSKQGDVVVALKCDDDMAIIRLLRTGGENYGVSHQDLLNKLADWRALCEYDIIGAGRAWVAIQFAKLPEKICAFAEEIYDFCPDTVDQGVGLQNEKDHPKAFRAARQLCPNLSERLEQKLQARMARFESMKIPPEFRAMIRSSKFTTPTDMGIRLLAYEIKQTKKLFLWWD